MAFRRYVIINLSGVLPKIIVVHFKMLGILGIGRALLGILFCKEIPEILPSWRRMMESFYRKLL